MKESATVLHTAHRDRHHHLHVLMLLLPSIAFVFVLSLFLHNRFALSSLPEEKAAVVSLTPLLIKDTSINVRIVKTEMEQKQGLSGTQNLPTNEGMLFLFPAKSRPAFWMKDMLIPLDLVWINEGKIIQIHKNVIAPPLDTPENKLTLYMPNEPIDSVLEVNAGFTDLHQISVGDSVTIP